MSFRTISLLIILLLPGTLLQAQTPELLLRPVQEERERVYDALHYRIDLFVDLENKSFEGSNTIELVPLSDGFAKCSFDIAELRIEKVTDMDGTILPHTADDKSLRVDLTQEYSETDTVQIIIHYSGHNPGDGLLFDDETDQWPQMYHPIHGQIMQDTGSRVLIILMTRLRRKL